MELGRQIIAELSDDSRHNVTSRWMAHHLAEVMAAAELDQAKAQDCKNLILELWRQRRFFPAGDPLERYTKLLSALEAHLEDHPSYVQIRGFGIERQSKEEQDLDTLAHSLHSHMGRLLSLTVLLSADSERQGRDDLIDIANAADSDAQSRLMSVIRFVLNPGDDGDDNSDIPDPVLETLEDLENSLATYRALYQSRTNQVSQIEDEN